MISSSYWIILQNYVLILKSNLYLLIQTRWNNRYRFASPPETTKKSYKIKVFRNMTTLPMQINLEWVMTNKQVTRFRGCKEYYKKNEETVVGIMPISIILIVAIVSAIHLYVQTYQVLCFKYVRFTLHT